MRTHKKKKAYLFLFLTMLFVVSISLIKACDSKDPLCKDSVVIKGTVIQGSIDKPLANANVIVTCTSNNNLHFFSHNIKVISNSTGDFVVYFNDKQCKIGSKVSIKAIFPGLFGKSNFEKITNKMHKQDCKVYNTETPIVPEFRYLTGILVVFSSIALFFIVRRK